MQAGGCGDRGSSKQDANLTSVSWLSLSVLTGLSRPGVNDCFLKHQSNEALDFWALTKQSVPTSLSKNLTDQVAGGVSCR